MRPIVRAVRSRIFRLTFHPLASSKRVDSEAVRQTPRLRTSRPGRPMKAPSHSPTKNRKSSNELGFGACCALARLSRNRIMIAAEMFLILTLPRVHADDGLWVDIIHGLVARLRYHSGLTSRDS